MTDEVYRPIRMLANEPDYCHVTFYVMLLRNHTNLGRFNRYFLGENLKPHLFWAYCIYFTKGF